MCRVTLQGGESGHALRAVGSSIPSCRPLPHAAERRMWHRTPCGERRHWALQCAGSRCRMANVATPSVRWEARFRPAGRCLTPRSGECGTALRAVSAAIGPCKVPGHAAGWRIWPRPPCGGKLDSVLQAAASRRGAACHIDTPAFFAPACFHVHGSSIILVLRHDSLGTGEYHHDPLINARPGPSVGRLRQRC